MPIIDLNIMQERELARLIEYERGTCAVNGELMYRCAFPLRPDDELQTELIARGVLAKKEDDRHGIVVAITSDGYSYFPSKHRYEANIQREHEREVRLVGRSALFAALCVIVGFILGRLAA